MLTQLAQAVRERRLSASELEALEAALEPLERLIEADA